jgi:arylsulfatase A-like enzyme
MNKMSTTRLIFLLVVVFLASCAPEKGAGPNIIFILADDLGYGDVSAYNPDSKISTPNIDKLASEGMRFTDAHSPSSVCTPTRYGILTGRYCWRTRLQKGVLLGYGQSLIGQEEKTVAELLRQGGYTTGVVGKWHLGLDWKVKADCADSLSVYGDLPILANIKSDWIDFAVPPANGPLTHGFDYSFILPASLDMEPYCYLENDTLTSLPDAYTPGNDLTTGYTGAFWREGLMAQDFDFYEVLPTFIAKAKSFVNAHAHDEDPFFLYLPLAAPHTPWVPKDDYFGKSGAGQYGDFVQMVDAAVGDFLSSLEDQGIADNTIVFFASDNGPYWKPEFVERFDHRAAHIYRGMKADAWDGGHRIPFIVRWPGKVQPGSVSDQLTTVTNLISTVAEVTGITLGEAEGMDSRSILPVLMGEASNNDIPVIHHSSRGMFAIRQGNWKYIEGLGSGGFSQPAAIEPEAGGPEGQLYNMKDDPSEQDNLFFENPDGLKELQETLDEIRTMK